MSALQFLYFQTCYTAAEKSTSAGVGHVTSVGRESKTITQSDAEVATPPAQSVQQENPLEVRVDDHLTLDDLIVYKPSFEGNC